MVAFRPATSPEAFTVFFSLSPSAIFPFGNDDTCNCSEEVPDRDRFDEDAVHGSTDSLFPSAAVSFGDSGADGKCTGSSFSTLYRDPVDDEEVYEVYEVDDDGDDGHDPDGDEGNEEGVEDAPMLPASPTPSAVLVFRCDSEDIVVSSMQSASSSLLGIRSMMEGIACSPSGGVVDNSARTNSSFSPPPIATVSSRRSNPSGGLSSASS